MGCQNRHRRSGGITKDNIGFEPGEDQFPTENVEEEESGQSKGISGTVLGA